jgi:hypothetical protein
MVMKAKSTIMVSSTSMTMQLKLKWKISHNKTYSQESNQFSKVVCRKTWSVSRLKQPQIAGFVKGGPKCNSRFKHQSGLTQRLSQSSSIYHVIITSVNTLEKTKNLQKLPIKLKMNG